MSIFMAIISFSYSASYQHGTLEPIQRIKDNQHYRGSVKQKQDLITALEHFRHVKSEELNHVTKAAALSAAAVVAVFSWPSVEHTIWVAKMLWHWSFVSAVFSLISSAHHRLLRHLPDKEAPSTSTYDDGKLQLALSLFLCPPAAPAKSRTICGSMLWVWQCPIMLMSYSWVLFLMGYALHVLTPVFDPALKEVTSQMAAVILCGAALPVINFIFCAALCQMRLRKRITP